MEIGFSSNRIFSGVSRCHFQVVCSYHIGIIHIKISLKTRKGYKDELVFASIFSFFLKNVMVMSENHDKSHPKMVRND